MEIKLSLKDMKVMVKKAMFLVIGCMALWWILMPSSLEEALYSAIKLQCKKKDNCIVHLHEITPFKWDKAYFFERTSPYYVDIDNIIGVQHKVIQDVLTTLVVFIRQGKIVQEDTFELIYSDYYDISFPPFFQLFPRESVDINFFVSKEQLKKLKYTGNLNDFGDSVDALYYEITPQNDQLRASCRTFYLRAAGSKVEEKQCGLSFTNLNQVVLFNPRIHKELK